jgi:acyl-CoA synthetase (AMP-forming)/AMP-acid ligase II
VEVQEKFQAITGGKLVEGYGLSEASPVTHANPIFGQNKIGTIVGRGREEETGPGAGNWPKSANSTVTSQEVRVSSESNASQSFREG